MKENKYKGKLNIKRRTVVFSSATTILAMLLVLSVSIYNSRFKTMLEDHVKEHLEEIASPSINSFNMQISEQINKVKMVASYVSNDKNELGSSAELEFLDGVIELNQLEECYILLNDGTILSNDKNIQFDSKFLRKSEHNETVTIFNPQKSMKNPDAMIIPFSYPIYKDNIAVGTIIYSYLAMDVDNVFNLEFLSNLGELILIDENGNQLLGSSDLIPKDMNVVDFVDAYCGDSKEKDNCLDFRYLKRNVTLNNPKLEEPLVIGSYKLGYNDWHMLAVVPETVAKNAFSNIFELHDNLTLAMLIVVCAYLLILFNSFVEDIRRYDRLTGLYTTKRFIIKAKKILSRNKKEYVFIKLDVRNFKLVNRILGVELGDKVLVTIASELKKITITQSTICCREGKDSFIFFLPFTGVSDLEKARNHFVKQFTLAMGDSFNYNVEFPVGQYVVHVDDPDRFNIGSILEKINFAHGVAKYESGSKMIADYREGLESKLILTKLIESEMFSALENGEFELYLQPKVNPVDEEICGAESLVRWVRDGKMFKEPTEFIPIFEKNGFIAKVDYYIFESTVKFIRDSRVNGGRQIPISVNFSRVHISNPNFVSDLCSITQRYEVPNELVEIELTESIIFENLDVITTIVDDLHYRGFRVAVDDFGTAYSSLSLIKNLKFDTLKLDKTFFDNCDDNERAHIVVQNIMNMAKQLHATTVAEGIENSGQVEMLRSVGCDAIQGFYYYKPLQASEVAKLLIESK